MSAFSPDGSHGGVQFRKQCYSKSVEYHGDFFCERSTPETGRQANTRAAGLVLTVQGSSADIKAKCSFVGQRQVD